MEPIIQVERLTKKFGTFHALDGLNLTVDPGSIHGFLGPNGSGKTTTIRVLLGLIRPTSGTVRVFGADPATQSMTIHKRTAYVPGDVALWPTLTGGETLDILARTHGTINNPLRNELIEAFQLDPRKKVSSYSKGNRQKVALIAALATKPELLILDEPTTGLDPLMYAEFAHRVTQAASAGTTVLLSSHILSEVEHLCDTTTIIRDGRTVQSGPLNELRALAHNRVTARTSAQPTNLETLNGLTNITITHNDTTYTTTFDAETDALPTAISYLSSATLVDLTCAPPTLEDLFLRYYKDTTSDGGAR
ncbi:ABC transporter ATP-binding protein [Hoyosella rhizosphaerae]|uniref:Tetronasin ABC transporter ATP-binding protein n=1 Tax=Hoyosella rhizosphaerae TaxID=1755582 RepID=A0A916UFB0_9ACTN|nr:ABC transporter ATP-binding protein [Hoyosella rhizosphaerae]MBN4925670.1 ABC transporter ATP-binding protein [Hoyosella rhizosphaerae]GGC68807.1 tetronasin ABC transporter ATP-binding protein [Hoyosella rhizosphaerae]